MKDNFKVSLLCKFCKGEFSNGIDKNSETSICPHCSQINYTQELIDQAQETILNLAIEDASKDLFK